MTSHWIALSAVLALASSQIDNGYINPLFLPRAQRARGGRLYDPWTPDTRDNGYYLSQGGTLREIAAYRDRGLPYDSRFDDRRYPSRYDNFRRYQNRYDDVLRNPNRYDDFLRSPIRYDDLLRYPNRYDDLRRYPNVLEELQRRPVDSDVVYRQLTAPVAEDVRYLTTARPDERILGASTAAPDLAVTVRSNGAAP